MGTECLFRDDSRCPGPFQHGRVLFLLVLNEQQFKMHVLFLILCFNEERLEVQARQNIVTGKIIIWKCGQRKTSEDREEIIA